MASLADLQQVKAQTGKTPADLKLLAAAKGLVLDSEIVDWLKTEFDLTHGHATAISRVITVGNAPRNNKELVAQYFQGARADWKPAFQELEAKIRQFGPDVAVIVDKTAVHLQRNKQMFGLITIDGPNMNIGIVLPGAPVTEIYQAANNRQPDITHRVQLVTQQQIDDELITWLRQAYDRAS